MHHASRLRISDFSFPLSGLQDFSFCFLLSRVTFGPRFCPINMNDLRSLRIGIVRKRCAAMSLTELLCVLAIITILAALYLPAVVRAFVRIKKFLGGL